MDVKELLERYNAGERNFVGIYLPSNADLSQAVRVAYGVNLSGQPKQILYRRDLHGLDLRTADFSGLDLRETNFRGVDLACTNLKNTNFEKANLIDADLSYSNVERAKFDYCYYNSKTVFPRGVDLSKAIYIDRNSDLSGRHLYRIDLSNFDLSGSNLQYSSIGTNLTNTNLSNTDLSYANLKGSTVEGTNFDGAIFYRTIMPDGSVNNSSGRNSKAS